MIPVIDIPYEQLLVFGNMRAAVFYKTQEWRRARYYTLTTRGNRCELCGAGTPWTPAIKARLTREMKGRIELPAKVDWLALAAQTKKEAQE